MSKHTSLGQCLIAILGTMLVATASAQTAWHVDTIFSEGLAGVWGASVAVDSDRNVHIVESDQSVPRHLRYFLKTPAGFQAPAIIDDSGLVFSPSSIAIDDADSPHVCYTRRSAAGTFSLWYAGLDQGSWTVTQIPDEESSDYGEDCAIAAHNEGEVHIAYSDQQNGFLKYVRRAQGAWQDPIQVDRGRDSTRDIAIALDRAHNAYIVYYHYDQGGYLPASIKLATNATSSGNFRLEQIENAGTLGGNTSAAAMTIDEKNTLHVGYYDAVVRQYKYARRNFQGWTIESVADGGDEQAGGATTVLVNALGHVRIVYADIVDKKLKYAARDADGTWHAETVDAEQDSRWPGPHAAAAMDSMGRVHIAYGDIYQATGTADFDLKYASNNLPGPDITLTPRFWSFGDVATGQSSTPLELTFLNSGSEPLDVSTGIGIYQEGFDISSGGSAPCPTFPLSLASGERCTLSVVFSPTSHETHQVYLPYVTNDPDTPSVGITLIGNPSQLSHDILEIVHELPQQVHDLVAVTLQNELGSMRQYLAAVVIGLVVVVVVLWLAQAWKLRRRVE